ncbi:MAG: GAF domain-containing protein [Desulfobacterales bacterium]|nr:GAF domain-containing protein [Desulfobacterales bacterium]
MLNHNEQLFQVFVKILRVSNDYALSYEDKLQNILLNIVECMNTRKGSIMVVKNRKTLQIMASTDPKLIGINKVIDDTSPSGWVVKHRQRLSNENMEELLNVKTNGSRYEKEAFLIIPILSCNKVIGVLSVTEKTGPDAFSESEQDILMQIASHVISSIETLYLAQQLRNNRNILKKKNQALKKLETLRTDLFNMLIHDLKGPISEVIANLDILSYTIDEDNREYVNSATLGCDTLYRMILDLLDIAQLEDGSMPIFLELLNPEELLNESVARLDSQLKMRQIEVQKEYASCEFSGFNADRRIILRVIQNLLTNAISFTPITEIIKLGYSYPDKNHILFHIKDNGPGIPKEFHQSIFDKYVKKDREGQNYSTGLGLAFCRMALEAHKGKIFVESDGVHGSCFYFQLPRRIKEII